MSRIYNFSAGPAALPEPVLAKAQAQMLDWQGSGMSVMEMSHRGAEFMSIAEKAESDLRKLLAIGDDYSVLFLQGGATLQFAMAAMNLATAADTADYVVTGSWGKKAVKEAARFVNVNIAADAEATNYTDIPKFADWQLTDNAAFVHYTPNETIGGVEFHDIPTVGDNVPLVADYSSTILSRPIDVNRYGLIYAGAQKNIGPAGLTIAIIRNDLLEPKRQDIPSMLQYQTHAGAGSMSNTPPTYAWYIAGLVFEWLLEMGGLDVIAQRNQQKAETLYAAIDRSDFYQCPVAPTARSRMNVPFTLADAALDKQFLDEAREAGLVSLKGHRSVGGMRASIYNAMPLAGVQALVALMADFEQRNG